MRPKPIVFIVDDDPVLLKTTARAVAAVGWNVWPYTSGDAFLANYDPVQPGCVVLAIRLPGTDGLNVQEVLIQRGAHLPVIFMAGYGDVPTAVQAMKAGAVDFLEKPFREDVLLARIEEAIALDTQRRQEQDRRSSVVRRLELLTSRQREVLDLVVAGRSNKEIAATLGISQRTVEIHRRQIMQKMKAASAISLAKMVFLLQT